jgi:hypothetical protein
MFYFYWGLVWAEKVVTTYIIDSANMLHNILLFYYFGCIIQVSIKFVNMNIFQIHNSVSILLPFVLLNSMFISLARVFQILEFHRTI